MKFDESITKILNVNGREYESLVSKLREWDKPEYRDQHLSENLYNIENIKEDIDEEQIVLTSSEMQDVRAIEKIINKKGCGLFRFIF